MSNDGYDRQARLLNVIYVLISNPKGIRLSRLAAHCGVHIRTTYRDLDALEHHMHVPLWHDQKDGLWGIVPGTFLPPVAFSRPEAMAIFMAARLLLAQNRVYNPAIASTFRKLTAVVDTPLREEVNKTLEWMEKRRTPDARLVATLNVLTDCWLRRKRARIRYWTLGREAAVDRVIEPYFIQPSALSNATYVIAFCHLRRRVLVFRLDRVHDVQCTEEDYEVPDGFDANVYLSPYWNITTLGDPQDVLLRFQPEVARIACETVWHDSQVTQPQTDGSALVAMRVAVTTDLVSFILGWSDMVEVLRPQGLKRLILNAAEHVRGMYLAGDSADESGRQSVQGLPPPSCRESTDATLQLPLFDSTHFEMPPS